MSRLRASYHRPRLNLIIPPWQQPVDMTDVVEGRDVQKSRAAKFEREQRAFAMTRGFLGLIKAGFSKYVWSKTPALGVAGK